MDTIAGTRWLTRARPVSRSPQITLNTPGGRNSAISSAISSVDAGVVSAGLSTMVLPAAMAGAHFQTAIIIGKFHGVTAAQTPIGSRRMNEVNPDMYSPAERPSSIRAAPAKNRIWSTIGGVSRPRLPGVLRRGLDDRAGPGLDRVRDPQQCEAALGRGVVPPVREGLRGRRDRGVDLDLAGDRRGGEYLAGARVDQLGPAVERHVSPVSADEVAQVIHCEPPLSIQGLCWAAGVRSSHSHGEP